MALKDRLLLIYDSYEVDTCAVFVCTSLLLFLHGISSMTIFSIFFPINNGHFVSLDWRQTQTIQLTYKKSLYFFCIRKLTFFKLNCNSSYHHNLIKIGYSMLPFIWYVTTYMQQLYHIINGSIEDQWIRLKSD